MSWTSTACRTAWLFSSSIHRTIPWLTFTVKVNRRSRWLCQQLLCKLQWLQWPASSCLVQPSTALLVVVCQFAHGRMEIGLWTGRWGSTSQSWHVQARHLVFCFEQLLTMLGSDWCHCLQVSDVFLLPPLSIQVRLLWFHDIINVSVSLSFLSNLQWLGGNGVPSSSWQILALMRVCLLLCRLRLSKSIESMNVACKKSVKVSHHSTVGSLWYDLASMIYAFARQQFQLGLKHWLFLSSRSCMQRVQEQWPKSWSWHVSFRRWT